MRIFTLRTRVRIHRWCVGRHLFLLFVENNRTLLRITRALMFWFFRPSGNFQLVHMAHSYPRERASDFRRSRVTACAPQYQKFINKTPRNVIVLVSIFPAFPTAGPTSVVCKKSTDWEGTSGIVSMFIGTLATQQYAKRFIRVCTLGFLKKVVPFFFGVIHHCEYSHMITRIHRFVFFFP